MCSKNSVNAILEDLPVLQTISNISNIPHLSSSDPESNTPSKVNFNYFDIHKFHCSPEINSYSNKAFSLLNCNIRSIQANFDNLVQFLNDLNYPFDIINLSETLLNRSNDQISNLDLPGYSFLSQPTTQRAGGVGMYIKKGIQYSVRHDLTSSSDESEMLWVEIESDLNSNMICDVVYQHPSSSLETFLNKFYSVICKINQERKLCLTWRGMTAQNLNKSCNDLMKKSQKLGKNKKKEELELLKQSLFHLPGSSAPMVRETLTPQPKKIAELKDENRGLNRSVSKMLIFSERLMDENDALIDDQAALEYEYFSTVEHMRTITNNIAGVAAKCEHERDAFEHDLKGLQE